jgi:YVTN family beta-propeller protein
MGLHSGEPVLGEDRYVGIGVHRAARIGDAAHGSQVLLSDATRALVEDDLPEGVYLRDLGQWNLKDIDRPERVWQLAAEGLQLAFPPLRGAEPVKEKPLLRGRSLAAAVLAGVIAAAVAIPVFALGGGSGGSVALAGVGPNAVGVIDTATGGILHSIPVGTRPSAVAVSAGSVWVANADDNSVSRIDLKAKVRTQTIPVGNSPQAIAVGGGFVWVANSLDGTVSKIDPNANSGGGGEVDRIPVGNAPTGVAYGAGRVWVANSNDQTVSEIAPGSRRAIRAIPVEAGADALAYGSGFVWVVSEAENSVTRIDARSGTVLPPFGVGNSPSAVAVGPDGAGWVADKADDTVHRIDPRSGRMKVIPVASGPGGVAITPGNAAWVSNEGAGTLSRIDAAQGKVVKSVATGNRPRSVAVTAGLLYVAVGTSGLAHRGGTLTLVQHDPFQDPFASANKHRPFSLSRFDLIDPAFAYDAFSNQAILLTNDGIVAFRAAGGSDGARLVPDLALAIPAPSDGGRTYTFQLRSGIRYSTGELVRPADFRRAIEREVANRGLYAGPFFSGIVGAAACRKKPNQCNLRDGIVVDPASNTVTFRLTAPDPDFLYKLAFSAADAVPADTPLRAREPLPVGEEGDADARV